MSTYKRKGFISGIIGSVSYGLNPLFALPMYNAAFNADSVLFYRYFFAVVIYFAWLKFYKRISLKINLQEFFCLLFLSVIFAISSLTLFQSFNYIDTGIACTILFVYPTLVMLISTIFFKEKLRKSIILSLLLTAAGILMLYNGSKIALDIKGVILVLLSALSYAIYMVGVKNIKCIKHIKYDKLSFYVMLLGLSVFIYNLKFCTQLQPINSLKVLACAVCLAIFPTVISLEAVNVAIKLIGASTASILGALEPLTAIFCGVIFFHESLSFKIIIGIILIITGVIMIMPKNKH